MAAAQKKKSEKSGKKGGDDETDLGLSAGAVLNNYLKYCKLVCVQPNEKVIHLLENGIENKQLVIDDEFGPLGPGGTRALCTAILGNGPGMSGVPCKLIKCIRMWHSDIQDDGAACIAELLRLGGAEIPINFLELMENGIGPIGAERIGKALSYGNNRSLRILKLDYNTSLSAHGIAALCQGLRTNGYLQELHLSYCRLGAKAGKPLAEMLSYRLSALTLLNLQGNQLGGIGIDDLCHGIELSTCLTTLSIADNALGQSDCDMSAIRHIATLITKPNTSLLSLDMLYNRIGEKGARLMLDIFKGKTPSKLKELLLDATLPQALFDQLCKIDVGSFRSLHIAYLTSFAQASGGAAGKKKKSKGKGKKKK